MSDTKVLDDRKYTEEHEWVLIQDGVAVVGITDYAQDQLGDVTFVELPEVDAEVEQMGEMAVVESVKAASDIYAPLSGVVVEVNERLEDEPGLINSDCYGEGWLVKIKDFDSAELDKLLDAEGYRALLAGNQ